MSQTISVGVVGPSYWLYMAAVMAGRLKKVRDTKRVDSGDIPEGAYDEAQEFLHLALQAAGDALPDNPPASHNAYKIAAGAVRRSAQSVSLSREELEKHLERFSRLIEDLRQPRDLNAEEVETVETLRRFFLQLKQDGEAATR